jgi:hypothetical protein
VLTGGEHLDLKSRPGSSKSILSVPLDKIAPLERWGDSLCNLKVPSTTSRRPLWLTFHNADEVDRFSSLVDLHSSGASKVERVTSVRAKVFDHVGLAGVDQDRHGANPLFQEEEHQMDDGPMGLNIISILRSCG